MEGKAAEKVSDPLPRKRSRGLPAVTLLDFCHKLHLLQCPPPYPGIVGQLLTREFLHGEHVELPPRVDMPKLLMEMPPSFVLLDQYTERSTSAPKGLQWSRTPGTV